MSFLNLNYGLIVFEDPAVQNPQIRTLDITRSWQGVCVSDEKTNKIQSLLPGDSQTVLMTARALGVNNTTQFALSHPSIDLPTMRMQWTGVGSNPVFRTKRAISIDATSAITITRQNPATARVMTTAGTNMVTTSVQVGDYVQFGKTTDSFTSLFNPVNQLSWKVMATGSNYIDVLDNGAMSMDSAIVLGATFDQQLRVLSAGPVLVGDTLEILGAGQNPNNIGKFKITDVSADWVEFTNPFGVDLTFTNNSNVVVYDRLVGFVWIRSSGPISVLFDAQSTPMRLAPIAGNETVFIGSVSAYQMVVTNEGQNPVTATIHHLSIT
jgi:hypothetical protein